MSSVSHPDVTLGRPLVQKIQKDEFYCVNYTSMMYTKGSFVLKVNFYKRADRNKLNICLNG